MGNKNIITSICFFLFVPCVFACGIINQKKVNPKVQCDIEKDYFNECLKSTLVSSYAKRIYLGEITAVNDSINGIIDSLSNGNSYYNQFYLLVITKAIPIADGASAEALAYGCKKYVETNSSHFFCMINGNKQFLGNILDKWTEIICSELLLESENITINAKKIFLGKIKAIRVNEVEQKKIQQDFVTKIELCNED